MASNGINLEGQLLRASRPISRLLVPAVCFLIVLAGLSCLADSIDNAPGQVEDQAAVVDVHLDITRRLSIGGRETLRREAYFNIHGTPGELTSAERDWLLGDLRANFGRSMGAISSFMQGLSEDTDRPGFADPGHMAERAKRYGKRSQSSGGEKSSQVEVVNSVHPYSYYGRADAKAESQARFIPGSYEAAAEVLTSFFSARSIEREPYFEIANECNVKTRELGVTFAEMCDLHVTLAERLHESVPGLKIGGPTSAWPAFEFNDFSIWHEQMGMFIERAGRAMDFLSLHLYTTHWDDKTVNRFGANIDAILDLTESQTLLTTGVIKPLLISECGTGLRTGEAIMEQYSPRRDWLILRGANHVLFNLIKRDDRLLKMIPFIVLKATWYKSEAPYPWVLFHEIDGRWEPTHLAKWYEFWRDVQGQHLPTECSSLDVQTHAVIDGSTAYLMLDNLSDSRAELRIAESIADHVSVEKRKISRLYYAEDEPQLVIGESMPEARSELTLEPHEACIIRYELSNAPVFTEKLLESTQYADRTLQAIAGKPMPFRIAGPAGDGEVTSATLRIGFGRLKSLSQQPTVRLNGKELVVPKDNRGECNLQSSSTFETKEVPVPVELLRPNNRVRVEFPDVGGYVSSVVLVTRTNYRSSDVDVAVKP